jgi:4'-phosphopantetheinyl transferase
MTAANSGFSASMSAGVKIEVRECCESAEHCVIPDLQPDTVNVWTRTLRVSSAIERACYEVLTSEERERAARYRIERPRNDFILTRGTLRSLLARYSGITPQELSFRYTAHGKPLLDGPSDLRFNVSHTDGLALIAFVRAREIGVDVEKINAAPDVRKLAERFFSIQERHSLEPLSGDELQSAFFRCWTRKEAYVKARGEGLSLPLHQFDVSVAPNESRALLATRPDPSEASRWTLQDLPVSHGYVAALAVAETRCTTKS